MLIIIIQTIGGKCHRLSVYPYQLNRVVDTNC